MKKIYLLVFALFLISLVSAGCTTCSKSGYRWCDECSSSYGDLNVKARVYFNIEDNNGDMWDHYPYAVGNLYINMGSFGSGDGATSISNDGYVFYNKPTWDSIWNSVSCNYNGCSTSGFKFTDGKNKLANIGESFTSCVQAISVSHASNDDYWAYSTVGRGWIGTSSCFDIKVVGCYDDSDCSNGQVCDKSGDWTTWQCGEDVECRSTLDCPAMIVHEKYCSGNELKEKVSENTCENNACVIKQVDDKVLESCSYKCEAVNEIYQCITPTCTEGVEECSGNDLLICQNNQKVLVETCEKGCENNSCKGSDILLQLVIGGSVILVVGGLTFLFITRKKRR